MKHIFYFILVTAASVFNITSCKKDTPPPVRVSTGNYTTSSATYTADLRADNSTRYGIGFYVHTFQNIIYPGALVKVYLVTNGKEEQINQYIFFMGVQLWVSIYDSDLKIYYRTSGPGPISLKIKVVIG